MFVSVNFIAELLNEGLTFCKSKIDVMFVIKVLDFSHFAFESSFSIVGD